MALTKEDKDRLHGQLIKLGDMMGDGLHHEPDGKWIAKEYRQISKALGLIPPKKSTNNSAQINERMAERIKQVDCPNCQQELKQTRSGSMKAKCISCGSKYSLLKRK
ncbi:MAG: hypothetical protein HRU38_10975 [Saccharospirillaceae bacterium]|nr:hypothetical protein [Saccharospirillaceae bacterium]